MNLHHIVFLHHLSRQGGRCSPSSFATLTALLPGFTRQKLIPSPVRQSEIPSESRCTPSLNFSSSTHSGGSEQTQLVLDVSCDGDPDSRDVARDADKLLKILSYTRPDSTVEAALDCASVVISPTLVAEVLRRLRNAGGLALLFFQWAERKKGFEYSTESYNALIEALGKIKQFNVVWKLVKDMKQKGLLTKETFVLMSRRYARARKVKEAIDAFEQMEKFGLSFESSDFNRLIDVLCKSRNVERAQQVFDKMKGRFKLDIKSYSILLEGWGQGMNFMRLMEVYREMKDEGFEPDVVTYGIMINALCKIKKYDDAIEMYDEMLMKNCKPTPHIFCTLINGLGSEKRLAEALKFFDLSKASGFAPEAPTYNALVGAYCWSMRIDDAFTTIEEMKKSGVCPNARTYDIILHHLIKARKTKQAYTVFQRMINKRLCEPTLSTYEIILRMFCNEDRTDMALRVWDQMKGGGILPGMHMFSTLITSLCHENKLDEACKYFQDMLDVGIRPPANTFSKLKQSLLDEGRKDDVLNLTRKIEKLRKTPLLVSR